jgi:hypothetical protein
MASLICCHNNGLTETPSLKEDDEEEMTKTTFRMPRALLKEVKHYATDHDTNDTVVFVDALKQYLQRHKSK